jgi:glycosyltransferase involved in cell wall biosynthesis
MTKHGVITVMFLIPCLRIGGTEQQLLDLVKGIDKARFQPLVVSLYPGGSLESEIKKVQGAEFISLDRKGKFDFAVAFKVLRLLRRKEVDIIQPFLTPATFFALLPAIADHTAARIVTERGRVPGDAGLGTKLYWAAEDFLTRFADLIVSNSDVGKCGLVERGIEPSRIRVIYNGVNFDRLMPKPDKVIQIRTQMGLPPGGQVVGIVGRLTPVKDHATFLQASVLISKVLPETRFAIVGDGELRGSLESMAKELNIHSRITFFGNQHDVGSYISAFDIACLCSLREGCSNAILEAMALGKPVVATDVGGNRELVSSRETGILVPPKNPQAMAGSIVACLMQPQWAQEMGLRAQQMVLGRFGQDRMVQEYQTLYEGVIESKTGGLSRKR